VFHSYVSCFSLLLAGRSVILQASAQDRAFLTKLPGLMRLREFSLHL